MRRSHLLLGGALGVHLLLALDGHFYWHDVRYLWATSRFSLGELLAGDWNPQFGEALDPGASGAFYLLKIGWLLLLKLVWAVCRRVGIAAG